MVEVLQPSAHDAGFEPTIPSWPTTTRKPRPWSASAWASPWCPKPAVALQYPDVRVISLGAAAPMRRVLLAQRQDKVYASAEVAFHSTLLEIAREHVGLPLGPRGLRVLPRDRIERLIRRGAAGWSRAPLKMVTQTFSGKGQVVYWAIGRTILERQAIDGWGSGVIGRLAEELGAEFPDMTGLSRSNLQYMRSFAEAWPAFDANVPQPVGHLPWATSAPFWTNAWIRKPGTGTPQRPWSTAGPGMCS